MYRYNDGYFLKNKKKQSFVTAMSQSIIYTPCCTPAWQRCSSRSYIQHATFPPDNDFKSIIYSTCCTPAWQRCQVHHIFTMLHSRLTGMSKSIICSPCCNHLPDNDDQLDYICTVITRSECCLLVSVGYSLYVYIKIILENTFINFKIYMISQTIPKINIGKR